MLCGDVTIFDPFFRLSKQVETILLQLVFVAKSKHELAFLVVSLRYSIILDKYE